jgi:hypothetical protein
LLREIAVGNQSGCGDVRSVDCFVLVAAGPALGQEMNAEQARRFVSGKPERTIKLLMSLLLKKSLLELTFNANEPFFGPSSTLPKIVRVGLKFACSFLGFVQL